MVETKKSLCKRKSIHEVRTMSCKDSIANATVERDDEWGHTVLSRVDSVIDLVVAPTTASVIPVF